MGIPQEPKPAKYFVALLSPHADLLAAIENDLIQYLGDIDLRSKILPWTVSAYYEKEMGPGLLRRFVAFMPLLSPGLLAEIKLKTQKMEDRYRAGAPPTSRKVNLDPGYLEVGKVVLASTKNAAHRIYLQSGIYGETTLLYYDGAFQSSRHTYPDYLWPETLSFFSSVRSLYLDQLKQLR